MFQNLWMKKWGEVKSLKMLLMIVLIFTYIVSLLIPSSVVYAGEASTQSNFQSVKQQVTSDINLNLGESNLLDWVHFAKDDVDDVYRKINPVASNKIGYTGVGTGTSKAPDKLKITDYSYLATWTEGDPVSTATNVRSAICYNGGGSYFEITAPSKANVKRTLHVYMGQYASQVDITATMGSETYSVEGIVLNSGTEKYHYTFDYKGDSASNDLVIRFTLGQGNDADWSNIGVSAITLSEEAVATEPTGSALPVQYVDQDLNVQLSNNNVVDWMHFNAITPNRKSDTNNENKLNATHHGTKAGFEYSIGDNGRYLVSYDNGTTNASVTDSRNFASFTGLDSYFEITAPSNNGVERSLDVYMGSWAAKVIEVTAKIGDVDIPVDDFEMATSQTKLAKYTINYTGTDSNEQLTVRFTLTDNSLDELWGCVWVAAVAMTEGEVIGKSTVKFRTPSLTGTDRVIVPASGVSKRRLTAYKYDKTGSIVQGHVLQYRLETPVEGVSLNGNLLTVSSNVANSTTVNVIAEDSNDSTITKTTTVEIVKDSTVKDTPANPLEKNGWVLYHNDEFNDSTLDTTVWSEYYLRNWTDDDTTTKADYYFEDGNLVIKTDEGIKPWSFQDGHIAAKSIVSYETNHLHKFGSAHTNRETPDFEGLATKYGYFEIRLKMPNTRDGSHFAWWMTGVQDDQNITAQLVGQNTYAGHTSNETGEFDIIEIGLPNINYWRPVIHNNGSTDYQYEHVPLTTIPGDPGNEFHVYGFEWDENGTKFYLDNQLVKTSTRTPNYRMMTYFSVYATGGMGTDRYIYPKEAIIDYFRIYKKEEPKKANSIRLNDGNTPNFIKVPQTDSDSVQMTATVLDQFDKEINATVKWKLSQTIDGFTPTTSQSALLNGVSIDSDTGMITVNSGASTNQDVFVTAYVDDKVKKTYHIRLSTAAEHPEKVIFDHRSKTVAGGNTINVSAQLYNQYKQPMSGKIMAYQISEDITGNVVKAIPGVSVDQSGNLTVASSVPNGTIIIVTAKADGKYQNLALKVEGNTTTMPSIPQDTDFGTVNTNGNTTTKVFTIENTGYFSANPIITISGPHAADFMLTNPVVTAGSPITFQITFDPSATGTRTATVNIKNDVSDVNPYNFAIQGTGQSSYVYYDNSDDEEESTPAPKPTNKLVKHDDGSAGIVVLNPTVDLGTKEAKIELSSKDIDRVFEETKENEEGIKQIQLEIPNAKGLNGYQVSLPKKALESNKEKKLEIKTDIGTVTLSGNMFDNEEPGKSSDINLSFKKVNKKINATFKKLDYKTKGEIGDRTVIDIKRLEKGKVEHWENENAPVKIAIPYTPTVEELINPENIIVYYIDEEGKAIKIPNGRYNSDTGMVEFQVVHFSIYGIGYSHITFDDLNAYPQAKHSIEVLAAKGITFNQYFPEVKMTRADFLTLLIKTLEISTNFNNNFEDIGKDNYYYEAIGIAKELGITSGDGNNRFNPEMAITREEMMTFVGRALRIKGLIQEDIDLSVLDDYTDKSLIAPYAMNNAASLVYHKIMLGSNHRINPKGNMTRAEAAIVLYKIYNMK